MLLQLHQQKLDDRSQVEFVEQAVINSRDEQDRWFELIHQKYEPPGYDDDWCWLICNEDCQYFKREASGQVSVRDAFNAVFD